MGMDSETLTTAANNHRALSSELDFGFAFNDSKFSDRILRIEIVPDSPENKTGGAGCRSTGDPTRNSKDNSANVSDEIVAIIEEESSSVNDSPLSILRVENINISSPILAAHSLFFYKLFSNGMKESEERYVNLQIHASEEDALMDLLNFMYCHTLKTSTLKGLLDVLMAADKFQVASCMSYCIQLLKNFPMTLEWALLYLDLPSSVSMTDALRPLIDSAKEFLVLQFKDLTKVKEEAMSLPLAGIEAVLSSNELHVASENEVFDLALEWARIHYPSLEDRREVLATRLYPLIRPPYMTCNKLREVLNCPDLEHNLVSELVLEAIIFKTQPHYRRALIDIANESNTFRPRCIERAYKYRRVQVTEFEHPCKQCIVYWDLKKQEIEELLASGSHIYTEPFYVCGQGLFSLYAHCNMDHFGVSLSMQQGSMSFEVAYEVSIRQNAGHRFVSRYSGSHRIIKGMSGYMTVFGMSRTALMAENCLFFINGVLHLRVQLTIRQ